MVFQYTGVRYGMWVVVLAVVQFVNLVATGYALYILFRPTLQERALEARRRRWAKQVRRDPPRTRWTRDSDGARVPASAASVPNCDYWDPIPGVAAYPTNYPILARHYPMGGIHAEADAEMPMDSYWVYWDWRDQEPVPFVSAIMAGEDFRRTHRVAENVGTRVAGTMIHATSRTRLGENESAQRIKDSVEVARLMHVPPQRSTRS
jgi:hypothetical protein